MGRLKHLVDKYDLLVFPQNYRFGPKAHLLQPEQQHTTTFHDPGDTRLKWNATPQTVLVIKKIRDEDVKEPFVQLIRCLLKVSLNTLANILSFTDFVNLHHISELLSSSGFQLTASRSTCSTIRYNRIKWGCYYNKPSNDD